MFLEKLMTEKGSRKVGCAMRMWKRLCVLAVLLCACGAAWGQPYSFFRWEGTLGDPSAKVYLYQTSDALNTNQIIGIIGNTFDEHDTDPSVEGYMDWGEPLDFSSLSQSLSEMLTNASGKVYILPRHNSTNPQIGNFTLPANVELSTYIGDTVTVTGNLEISGTVNTHCAFVFNSGSTVTIKDDAVFNLDDSNGSITSAGTIIIEADGNSNGKAGTFNAKSGKLTNTGTIENAGTFVNSATFTNSGEIINTGSIENKEFIDNTGTITNNGTIDTSGGDFLGKGPEGSGIVNTGINNYVINGTTWDDDSSWLGGSKPPYDSSSEITITLNNDVTATNDIKFTGVGPYVINLNGHTLKLKDIELNAMSSDGTKLYINGSGTVETDKFDSENSVNSYVYFSSRVVFKIKEIFFGNLSPGKKLYFSDEDGTNTLYIPASGANVNYGANQIEYSTPDPNKEFPKAYGEPAVYTMEKIIPDDLTTTNGTITVFNRGNDTSSHNISFKYIVDEIFGSDAVYSIDGTAVDKGYEGSISLSGTGNSSGSVKVSITISATGTIAAGEGIIIKVYTPDESGMELGKFRYIKEETTWTGAASSDWNVGTNWSSGSVPATDAEVIIPSSCANYPDITGSCSVKSITIENNANIRLSSGTLTVTNLSTFGTGYIKYVDDDSGTVNFKGESSWYADNPEESEFPNISIDNSSGTIFTPASDLYIRGNFTNSGKFDGSAVKTVFIPQGTTATVTGNGFDKTIFGSLSCTNQGGKEISFAGNMFVQNLSLSGTSGGLLKVTGGSAKINLPKSQKSGQYLNLSVASNIPSIVNSAGNVDATNLNFTAYNSNGTAADLLTRGWRAGPTGVYVWTGINTDWNSRVNWNKNAVPPSGSQVVIPSGCDLYPILTDSFSLGDGEVIVENGALLDLDTNTFRVKKITIEGTIRLDGSQTLNPLSVAGGTLSFTEESTIEYYGTGTTLALKPDDGFKNLIFDAGSEFTITGDLEVGKDLTNNGTLVLSDGNLIFAGALENNGIIKLSGDFNNSANATSATSSGTGTVEFTGSGTSKIYGDNTFGNLTCTEAGKTLKFQGGKTQTVNGKITIKGTSSTSLVNLESTDTTQWILNVTSEINDTNVEIEFVEVSNSIADPSLISLGLGTAHDCEDGGNTTGWFANKFFWVGVTSDVWGVDTNWEDEDGNKAVPPTDDEKTEIVIKDSSTNTLLLGADIKVKTLTVDSDQTVDFGGKKVTVIGEDGIINNGTIRLTGGETITGKMQNGSTVIGGNDESTIVYYGTSFTSLPWDGDSSTAGNQYDKLVFATDASGSSSEKLVVAKTTEINSTNNISISGTFTDGIVLKSNLGEFGLTLVDDATLSADTPSSTDIKTIAKLTVSSFGVSSPKTLTIEEDSKISVTSTTTFAGCNLTNNGKLFLQGETVIGGNLTNESTGQITSTSGDFTVNGNLENKNSTSNSFSVSGDLTVDGTTKTAYPILTGGNQTYNDDFTYTGAASITPTPIFVVTKASKTITFEKKFISTGNADVTIGDSSDTDVDTKKVIFNGDVSGVKELKSYYKTTVKSSITTIGNQTYAKSVTLIGDATFVAVDNSAVPISPKTITFGAAPTPPATSSTPGFVVTGSTDTYKLKIIGNAVIYGENEFKDITVDNNSITAETFVKFEGDKIQKIKACKFSGNENHQLKLTAISTPSSSAEYWLVNFTNIYDSSTAATGTHFPENKFDYVVVEYSKSVGATSADRNPLKIPQSFTHACEQDLNTEDWFVYVFYWVGTNSSDWTDRDNWRYEINGDTAVLMYPPIEGYRSEIFVATRDSKNILELGEGIDVGGGSKSTTLELKKLDVMEDKILDIGKCKIKITEEFANSGTVRLDGSLSTNTITVDKNFVTPPADSSTQSHSDTSTIEYYGGSSSSKITSLNLFVEKDDTDPSKPITKFHNLSFADGANFEISEKIAVNGSTKIIAGDDGIVSLLNGENQYYGTGTNDELIIGDTNAPKVSGGAVTIVSDNEIKIKSDVYCKTLDLQTKVNFDAAKVEVEADTVTFNKDVKSQTLVVKADVVIPTDIDVSFGKSLPAVNGAFVLGGSLTTDVDSVVAFDYDVLFAGETGSITLGGGDEPIAFNGNFVLYDGDLKVLSNVNVAKDIVLYGASHNDIDATTGINNFAYKQYRGAAATNYDDTTILSVTTPSYTGKLTIAADTTIKSTGNFYANGLAITGDANNDKSLSLSKNYDGSSFAEAYNCTVKNVKFDCSNYVAGTDPDPATGNILVKVNAYKCISSDWTKNPDWDSEELEIHSACTIFDNIVKVELMSGPTVTALRKPSAAVGANGTLKYSDGYFEGVYSDAACTTQITGDFTGEPNSETPPKTVFTIYLKASGTWNTDATGKLPGHEKSTNLSGDHQTSIPYLDFARTVSDVTKTTQTATEPTNINVLMTRWGKKIKNYHPTTAPAPVTPASAKKFEDTEDKTNPVLIAVTTGQEVHTNYSDNPDSQHAYDAHNFIEFVYSEPINFDNTSANGGTGTISIPAFTGTDVNYFENVRTEESLGKIENVGNGISIFGILNIPKGKVVSGAIDSSDGKTVHAFYRKNGMTPQSIRLSIAGYVNGTVEDNDHKQYKQWIGYIDESVTPETPGLNDIVSLDSGGCPFITDKEGNAIVNTPLNRGLKLTDRNAKKNDVKVTTEKPHGSTQNDYGAWDCSEPVFAIYRRAAKTLNAAFDEQYYEVIGSTEGSTSLTQIEFHLFDNKHDRNASFNSDHQWISRRGWVKPDTIDVDKVTSTLRKNYSYAADIFGGSRPFDDDTAKRTTGGIRYSSLLQDKSRDAFKYIEGTNLSLVPTTQFNSSYKAYHTVSAPMFLPTSGLTRNADAIDGLYFSYVLNTSIASVQTSFIISYDDSVGVVTDLAGNRLKSAKIRTKDLTSPNIAVSIAPVGQNKLYLMFTKQLTDRDIKMNKQNASHTGFVSETRSPLVAFADAFELGELTNGGGYSNTTTSGLQIDSSVPAKFLFRNSDYSGIELTLNKNVTFADIEKVSVLVKNLTDTYTDPNTDILTDLATFVQDDTGNYMPTYAAHALSDFAVNVVNPLYAYNENILDDNNQNIQLDLYGNGSNAVHDWSAEQQNYGTLLPKDEIHIISDVYIDGVQEYDVTSDFIARLFIDRTPDPESVSIEYNRTARPSDTWRIWLPQLSSTPNPFLPVSDFENTSVELTIDGAATSSEHDLEFVIPENEVSKWASGDQIKFIIGLFEVDGTTLKKVVHVPTYDYNANKYDLTSTSPLFALRLKRPNDLTSVDLWSFKLKSTTSQRGGVSIFNNVIDAGKSEKTIIKIDNPKNGRVDVIVMTLDGNVVTYLNRGDLAGGEHYFTWNGHTQNGKTVARGIYFVRVIGNGFDETRKVMVTK